MVENGDQQGCDIPDIVIPGAYDETEGNASPTNAVSASDSPVKPSRLSIQTEQEEASVESADPVYMIGQVPEFQEVLADTPFSRKKTAVDLQELPNIEALEAELMEALQKEPGSWSVETQVRALIDALKASKENERVVSRSLQATKDEYDRLAQQAQRDTRAVRMMQLADRWRKENRQQEEVNEQLMMDVQQYQVDLKDMDIQLEIMDKRLQTTLKRSKDMKDKECRGQMTEKTFEMELKLKHAEFKIKKLEKSVVEKKSKITELKREIEKPEEGDVPCDILEQRLRNCEREKAALMAAKTELQGRATNCKFNLAVSSVSLKAVTKEVKQLMELVKTLKTKTQRLQEDTQKQNQVIQERTDAVDRYRIQANEYKHEMENLIQTLKDKELRLTRANQDVKHRDALLFHKQGEMDQLKAKFNLLSTKERSEVQAQNTLGKKLTNLDKENQVNLRKIDLLNGKANKVNNTLKEHQKKIVSALGDADGLRRTLDDTVPQLKKYIAANKGLFEDSLLKDGRITELQRLSSHQMRSIKNGERNIMSLMHKINCLEVALEKTHDSLGMCNRNNCKLVSEAFENLENARQLQHYLKTMAVEIKTGILQMDGRDRLIQSLLLKEVEMNEVVNKKTNVINILHAEADQATSVLNIKQHQVKNLSLTLTQLEESLKKAAVKERELIHQRDVFAARVVQAKVELQLQDMKIRTLEDVVSQGHVKFNQQVNDKALLVREIKSLRKTVKAVDRIKVDKEKLKDDVVRARRKLAKEEIKNKTQEEMVPTRLHPLRNMSHDSSEYEKILKIQHLSRLLIKKTDTVVDQENKIISQEKKLQEMKQLLDRHTQPNLAFQVIATKADLTKKNKRIKSLNAELNMFNYEMSRERDAVRQTEIKYQEELDRANKTNAIFRTQPRPPQSGGIQPNPRRANTQRSRCLPPTKTEKTPKLPKIEVAKRTTNSSTSDKKPSETYGDIPRSRRGSDFVSQPSLEEESGPSNMFGLKKR